jgi:hypothetical protein
MHSTLSLFAAWLALGAIGNLLEYHWAEPRLKAVLKKRWTVSIPVFFFVASLGPIELVAVLVHKAFKP